MKTLTLAIFLLATTCFAQERKLGWLGDDGDKRVMSLRSTQWPIQVVKPESNLTKGLPSIYDQGNIGSCVANGTLSAYSYAYNAFNRKHVDLSRLQVYYDGRVSIGTARVDSGCQIVDVVNNLQRKGAAQEKLWPYQTNRFTVRPTTTVYNDARKKLVVQAFKVDNTDRKSIRLALTNGYPVIVGSLVWNAMMNLNSRNYTLPMPRAGEKYVGGHCYLITGHDDVKQLFRGRNSWGKSWGKDGDFLLPYAYIHSGRITEDCWVIVQVTK